MAEEAAERNLKFKKMESWVVTLSEIFMLFECIKAKSGCWTCSELPEQWLRPPPQGSIVGETVEFKCQRVWKQKWNADRGFSNLTWCLCGSRNSAWILSSLQLNLIYQTWGSLKLWFSKDCALREERVFFWIWLEWLFNPFPTKLGTWSVFN